MKSINGIYDGKSIVPLEPTPGGKRYKVIITFTEEIQPATEEAEDIRDIHMSATGFDFWANEAENVYQDLLPKSKTV